MSTLETAYKILYSLEHKRKADYMGKIVGPEALKVDKAEWLDVIQMLLDDGYIRGITIAENIVGGFDVDVEHAKITLKGAEYLQNNSVFAKFRNVATDVISIIR